MVLRFFVPFLVLGLAASRGQAYNLENLTVFQHSVNDQAALLNEQFLATCRNCAVATSPAADPQCRARYGTLFGQPVVRVHFAFGYLDQSEEDSGYYGGEILDRNDSVDEAAHEGLARELLAPCKPGFSACGFQRMATDSDLLVKNQVVQGHAVQIQLTLTHASATPRFSVNVGARAAQQSLQTEVAEKNFFGSFDSSDLSIYLGHARAGGGPDFHPPHLKRDRSPDYDGYYRKKRPGFAELLQALRVSPRRPALLAILGCRSDPLFRREILKIDPQMGLVTLAEVTFFEEAFKESFFVLDGFLRQECAGTLSRTLNLSGDFSQPNVLLTNFR